MLNKDKIIEATGLHPLKVKNIYLYGSRVYGTATGDSDYDVIVVANSMDEEREIVSGELNIHVLTPDKFIRDLKELDSRNLECVFAPDHAKIMEKVNYIDANFSIKPEHMKFKAMQQSFNRFHTAKLKMIDGDTHRGSKNLFYSFKILLFAQQILKHGKIIDFTEANQFWSAIKIDLQLMEEVNDGDEMWRYFKDKYLSQKIELEQRFKSM
jgi:predicted nucleotidyltransferase